MRKRKRRGRTETASGGAWVDGLWYTASEIERINREAWERLDAPQMTREELEKLRNERDKSGPRTIANISYYEDEKYRKREGIAFDPERELMKQYNRIDAMDKRICLHCRKLIKQSCPNSSRSYTPPSGWCSCWPGIEPENISFGNVEPRDLLCPACKRWSLERAKVFRIEYASVPGQGFCVCHGHPQAMAIVAEMKAANDASRVFWASIKSGAIVGS